MSSSLTPLSLLPAPLLAIVASHLQPDVLLRLQRCSSAYRRLRDDEAYMSVAWGEAVLHLSLSKPLHHWAVPREQCIQVGDRHLIPLTVWQAALPALRRAFHITEARGIDRRRIDWLRRQLKRSQVTEWIAATQRWSGDLWLAGTVSSADGVQQSTGVRRVEVLRDVDWERLDVDAKSHRTRGPDVDVRSRLVLSACPYLQHLHLGLRILYSQPPLHKNTFARVPRLRSLSLDSARFFEPPLAWQALLDSLPSLTSLSYTHISGLDIDCLLAIASHSTLERLQLDSGKGVLEDKVWLGHDISFPIGVDEDERQVDEYFDSLEWEGDVAAQTDADEAAFLEQLTRCNSLDGSEELSDHDQKAQARVQRMRTALTRTQPTQRSCEVRLELADWLHRRLRRDKLNTDDGPRPPPCHPKSLLLFYRMLLVLLRSTLMQQLCESAAKTK